jgi:hypothetical protein
MQLGIRNQPDFRATNQNESKQDQTLHGGASKAELRAGGKW